MSVPVPLRKGGHMEVHTKAHYLAVYTSKILSNKKIFKEEIDNTLIERIKSNAYDIYTKSWSANSIRADTNKVNRIYRYNLQEETILLCEEMLANIHIAKCVFHLRNKRIQYWSGLITDVKNLLQGWKESDVQRFGQP